MPTSCLRGDLIPALCDLLPAEDAVFIAAMNPDEYVTHVETYASIRRHDLDLPDDLLRGFVAGLLHYLERPPVPA